MMKAVRFIAAFALASSFTACFSSCSKKEAPPPSPTLRAFVTPAGFDSQNVELNTAQPLIAPMKMAIASDGRIFVTTQAGTIRIVENDILLPTPFLTISGVETFGDDGLQAIALDPDFATTGQPGSGRFYTVHHFMSGSHGRPRVSIYRASSGNPNVANTTPEATFDLDSMIAEGGGRPGSHTGATLQVGKDGALYVAVGMQDCPASECQDWTKSASKILRFDRSNLGPASGNPYATSGTNEIQKRVWGRGFRNPFNMAVDRVSGEIFVDDVGSNHVISPNPLGAFEETNAVPNPGLSGFVSAAPYDFGWPTSEGTGPHLVHRFENGQANENSGGQDCAKIGGDFYRPNFVAFPASYVGAYFYADFCSTYLRYLPDSQQTPTTGAGAIPTNAATEFVASTGVAITDIETHPNGAIYFVGRSTPERQGSAVGLMYKIFTSGPVPLVSVTAPTDGQRFSSGNPGVATVDIPITITASDSNGGLTLVEALLGTTVVGSCTSSPCNVTATGLGRGTYTIKGRATNVLGNTKTTDGVVITVDGPNAVIATPVVSSTFVAGQAVSYSGSATDASGNAITTASAFTWNIYLNHGTHRHLAGSATGTTGSFTLPTHAETDPNISLGFFLTVTDSFGVSHTTSRTIQPVKPQLTLATTPVQGLSVKLDSSFKNSNFAFDSVAGIVRTIGAPLKQLHPTNGRRYEFLNWSHGGAYQHTISTPQTNTTYTANYRDATGTGTGLYGEYFANTSFGSRQAETNEAINFDWGTSAPKPGQPADGFTIRWTGKVQPYFSEAHTFYVDADGGVRLWVNGNQVINSWTESASERATGEISLTGGTQYNITLEYIDNSGPARVKLSWATSGVLKEVIPATQLIPATVIGPPPPTNEVLFVVGSTTLSAADQALRDRIVNNLGRTIDVVAAPNLTTSLATASGRKVVLVSETVTSSDIGTKLTTAAVPVVNCEPAASDDLGFTTNAWGTTQGTTATTQTALNIVAPSDALAAGLASGNQTVSSAQTFIWGVPGGSPTVVARIVGSATQAGIYRYDTGQAMQSGTAPHRRVGFFLHTTTASGLNANGWALFDAAMNWAIGAPPPPPVNQAPTVSAGPDRVAEAGTSLNIDGSASDDGLPNPPATLTVSWSQISGPGTATITSGSTADPQIAFPAGAAGTYVFRITGNDSELTATDDMSVTVSLPVVATPTITPNGGSFSTIDPPPSVTLATATTGAELRYTVDGSEPTASSTLYSGAFTISANTTLKAKGFKADHTASGTATATFTFTTPTVATPTFSPGSSTYTTAQSVTISTATSGADIYYTTDGSDPTTGSTLYSTPVNVGVTTTLKARAYKSGWNDSAIGSATYTFATKTALFVVGNTTLTASDSALKTRLEGLGFTVTVKQDSASVSGDAAGKSLVLISETCGSANVGNKFLSTSTPVITCEPAVQDDLSLTGAGWGADQGTATGTQVNVLSSAGALAAGFSGNTTVVTASSTFIWGVPGASATVISRVVGSSTQATSYKYEQGATLISGTAAGKRAAFFAHGATAVNHNTSAWSLFDALVNWAVP
jgi:hypothetical protein